jgi:retron-type reverse transcriptase
VLLVILVCGSYNRVWIFQHIYPNFYFICEGMKMIKNTKTITINTRITTNYVYVICLNIIMNVHTNMNINDGAKHAKGSKSDCVHHMEKLWTRLKDCVVRVDLIWVGLHLFPPIFGKGGSRVMPPEAFTKHFVMPRI